MSGLIAFLAAMLNEDLHDEIEREEREYNANCSENDSWEYSQDNNKNF